MRKPPHKVAVAMWAIGVIVLLLWAWALFDFLHTYPIRAGSFGGLAVGGVAAAILIALGTIIELIDQIRWNALPPEQRDRP
jgi:hypothetical protein